MSSKKKDWVNSGVRLSLLWLLGGKV